MKKVNLWLAFVVLPALFLWGGCVSEPKGFVKDSRPGMTSYDAQARIYRSASLDMQMAWEDWDHFWMVEKPSRLNWLRN